MKKKFAFTLSEMLIVITIIGTISALTIPSLLQSSARRENVSMLKKSYSTLSQAVSVMQSKYGPIKYWPWSDVPRIGRMFSEHLNIVDSCVGSVGCFTNQTIKFLNNQEDQNYYNTSTGLKYKLADGQGVVIDGINMQSDTRVNMIVDINGDQGPNQWGRDIFKFDLDVDDGLLPAGSGQDVTNNCAPGGLGNLCAAKVIAEGKMDY